MVEVSDVIGPQLRSPHAAVAKSPPGRIDEPPLDILPISVWSPSAQSAELPSRASEGEGRKHLGHKRDEDSLLASAELTVRAVSSILGTLTSRGQMLCPLRRLWPYRFRERPPYVQTPLFVRSTVISNYPLILSRFCRWLPI